MIYSKILLVFLLFACSSQQTNYSFKETGHDGVEGVFENDLLFKNRVFQINQKSAYNSDDGPQPDAEIVNAISEVYQGPRIPVVALTLGPGLNRVIAYTSLLASLVRNKVPVHLISGTGLGAVVAAMYAKGLTSSRMEWIFYKFFSKSQKVKPFSKKWIKLAEEHLLSEFKDDKVEDLSVLLVLPVYSRIERKVKHITHGSLYHSLYINLMADISLNDSDYSPSFIWNVYDREYLKKFGTDIVIGVSVLGEKVYFESFEMRDDFLVGLFNKILNQSLKDKDSLDLFFQLEVNKMPLDGRNNIPSLLRDNHQISEDISKKIINKIKNWTKTKENNLGSFL